MQTVKIHLGDVSAVKDFNQIVSRRVENIDLASGRYIIDAKSIMGCFSLDLSKVLELTFHSDDKKAFEECLEQLSPYVMRE